MKHESNKKFIESSKSKPGRNGESPMKNSMKQKRLLKKGVAVVNHSKTTKWRVMSHIGAGGFGDVYMVFEDGKNGKSIDNPFAMKTEIHSKNLQRLHIEHQILKEVSNFCKINKKPRHFCDLIDYGNTKSFLWIVMTLIGPSLESVRKMLKRQYSTTTVINISFQTLEALSILHEVGFIHRDLKPGNICVGIPPSDHRTIYILDFGISRRIYRSVTSKVLRKERDHVPFFGTRKFCSRACHVEKDQGRKDDIEVWIYTILDLFHNEKGLPWSKESKDPAKIFGLKLSLFEKPEKVLHSSIPTQFRTIIKYVGTLEFLDSIDYKQIENELNSVVKENNLKIESPLDWESCLSKMMETKKVSTSTNKTYEGCVGMTIEVKSMKQYQSSNQNEEKRNGEASMAASSVADEDGQRKPRKEKKSRKNSRKGSLKNSKKNSNKNSNGKRGDEKASAAKTKENCTKSTENEQTKVLSSRGAPA